MPVKTKRQGPSPKLSNASAGQFPHKRQSRKQLQCYLLEQVIFFCGSAVLVLLGQLVVLSMSSSVQWPLSGILLAATALPSGLPHIFNAVLMCGSCHLASLSACGVS